MIDSKGKLSQAKRIAALTEELTKLVTKNATNRLEAQAALRSALEVVSTFPKSEHEDVCESA
jgi:hypothetical protein